jgi:sulfur carrier protein
MKIAVNGEGMELVAGSTVADVLAALGCGTRGVAVALNFEVVRRVDWPDVKLADGDEVEVLHAVAGG